MVSTGWMQQEGGTERDRALLHIGGLKVKPKGLEQWLQTLLGCPGTPSPLPSSLPRCCGGSLVLCWKRPLCSSHGRRRRTVRRPHHRRCCRSSQTTGSLRHRAWVRHDARRQPALLIPFSPALAKLLLICPLVLLSTSLGCPCESPDWGSLRRAALWGGRTHGQTRSFGLCSQVSFFLFIYTYIFYISLKGGPPRVGIAMLGCFASPHSSRTVCTHPVGCPPAPCGRSHTCPAHHCCRRGSLQRPPLPKRWHRRMLPPASLQRHKQWWKTWQEG